MLKRARQPNASTPATQTPGAHTEQILEPCPYCMRGCDVVHARDRKQLECLSCGAVWHPHVYYALPEDPRHEIEDPDDRPYLWDLE